MYISMVALSVIDTYEQHQAIWELFPNSSERKRDHLFRVENINTSGQVMVLLQSASEPQSNVKATVLQSKLFDPQISQGEYYKFKLLANPTKCLSQGKKVIEIKDENEQIQWLQRKLRGANVTVTALESVLVKSRKSFTSRFVCFEGILQVDKPDQIYSVLVMGIGRKKHAGAGLLSLAKAS
ncbi:type I-E CRISPR-associated protein Cas6/Cse3/CasE [Photobacterium profundum]|nr:type I-E CRISPR-associated protein Cas6/Cse3/CasE [Photobacterium profundum]